MGKPTVTPPAERSLFDLELVQPTGHGTEAVVPGWKLAGLLKLGGPSEVGARLVGLVELLEAHEGPLSEESVTFVRGALDSLADAFYGQDECAHEAFLRTWRVQPRQTTSRAVA